MRTYFSWIILLGLTLLNCNGISPNQEPEHVNQQEIVPFSLDELQKRSFNYFWDLGKAYPYQILDRYPKRTFSSIAATGFGLTSYLVGVKNNYVTRKEAADRVLNTLKVLKSLPKGDAEAGVAGYKGFFYHFLTLDKAVRYKQVELSTIDTGLLMAGVLSVLTFFDQDNETEQSIRVLADELFREVDWNWAFNENGKISMGWRPERGFISHDWKGYNEAMILLIMAMGSPSHPIPASAWEEWCKTYEWEVFEGEEHLNFSPLFGHQYSHMYIDFRGIKDAFMEEQSIDYFENSRRATYANQAYCIRNPNHFKGYGSNLWGLTACDGPKGEKKVINGDTVHFRTYWARGASSRHIRDDGTIAPTAAGGSIPFAPEICIPTLKNMWNVFHHQLVDEYGFRDAFNLTYNFGPGNENGWFDPDYIGIDQGPIVLQIENYKSGFIWELMKQNPYIIAGLKKAGFKGGWLEKIELN